MAETAHQASLVIDTDKIAVQNSIDFLLYVLQDCIPRNSLREAERTLYETFEKGGFELTSKRIRKEYEAWKDLHDPMAP